MNQESGHLPVYGPGPAYVGVIVALTAAGIALSALGVMPVAHAGAGVILVYGNLWLLVLLPVFWAFFTVLMRTTEEKWLLDLYGEEYADYCRRVNRCIPWFQRR